MPIRICVWLWSQADVDRRVTPEPAHQVTLGWRVRQPVAHHGNLAYGLKMATHNTASAAAYRSANGRDLLHARGFWRGTHGQSLTQPVAIALGRWIDR